MRVWRRRCSLGERPFCRFIGPSSPWERRKERAPPRAGCCLPGALVVFLLPPAKEGGESGRMRRIRPPLAWLGSLSPPGEGRPSFPLSPALKGRWPVRGADRWGETRGRSPPCQRGRERPRRGTGPPLFSSMGTAREKTAFRHLLSCSPWKRRKERAPPRAGCCLLGALVVFLRPPAKEGTEGEEG